MSVPQHRLGLCRVASVGLVQHEAGKQAHAGAASFPRLDDDADRRLAVLGEQREEGDGAEAAVEQRQELEGAPAAYGSR